MIRERIVHVFLFMFVFISIFMYPVTAYADSQEEEIVDASNESQSLLLTPYRYTPMEPDEWRQQLSSRAGEIGAQNLYTYPNSAAFITSVADSIGLCSVNVFKATADISTLFRYLALDKNMEIMPASILGDLENGKDNLSGDIIFLQGDSEDDVYENVGIIVDIDEQKVSLACVIDGTTSIIGIKRDSFSQNDTIVHVAYETSEKIIWDELCEQFPYYNDAAKHGILANIFQESAYNSTAIGDGGMSYGLCQWYKERNVSLVNYAVANSLTLDNIRTQLMFIKYELSNDERFSALSTLLSETEDSRFGAYNAAYFFCLIYENPADTVNQAHYRGGIAQSAYSYYHPVIYEAEIIQEEARVETVYEEPTQQIQTLSSLFYRHGDEDLILFIPAMTVYDSILLDSYELPRDAYELTEGAMIRMCITHEYMNTLPSGWHDLSFVSDNQVTTAAIRVEAQSLSTVMSKPSIDTAATAIIITDAPAPRGAVDISAKQDNGVVLWYEGYICYISTQRQGVMVSAPSNCSYLFSSEADELLLANVSYIDVKNLDMSNAEDISYMFRGAGINTYEFNIVGLDLWDVSRVSNAGFAFCESGFKAQAWSIGSLSRWRVSNITDMTGMFKDAGHSSLSWSIGDISNWDTHSCISMASMFEGAGYSSKSFVLDLSHWDMSSMVSLKAMFKNTGYYADVYSLNLSGWNLSNVRILSSLFENAGYYAKDWSLGDGLESWDVSKVTDMSYMFAGAGYSSISYSFDFGRWDVSVCEDMSHMFEYAGHNSKSFELNNLGQWKTGQVKDMSCMFAYSGFYSCDYRLNICAWDTGSVRTMEGMFKGAGYSSTSFYLDLSGWNISNVVDMSSMFENTAYSTSSFALIGLSTWDTKCVQTTESMFMGMAFEAYDVELNLNNWDMSANLNMVSMFKDMGAMSGIFSLSLENWTINPETDLANCFTNTGTICRYSPPDWYRR